MGLPAAKEIKQNSRPGCLKRSEIHFNTNISIERSTYLISEPLEVLLVEQNEPQEWPGHAPLVAAVLEHDDIEHCGQHLLQDLRASLHHLNQGVVLWHHLAPADFPCACHKAYCSTIR